MQFAQPVRSITPQKITLPYKIHRCIEVSLVLLALIRSQLNAYSLCAIGGQPFAREIIDVERVHNRATEQEIKTPPAFSLLLLF